MSFDKPSFCFWTGKRFAYGVRFDINLLVVRLFGVIRLPRRGAR
jgi:hypothetical protein